MGLSRWMESFTCSRRSFRRIFILGNYLGIFGMRVGRRIWINWLKIDYTIKNKNWKYNNFKQKTIKSTETKTETKSDKVDDSKSVLSDITFKVAAAPARVQSRSVSDITSIPENTTTKGIFSATDARMQV